MNKFSIVFFTLAAFASTASADGAYEDVKKPVPDLNDAIHSPVVSTKDIKDLQTSKEGELGTSKGDATPQKYIGETEKNLSGGGRGWGRGDARPEM